jgi:hypothetical protein
MNRHFRSFQQENHGDVDGWWALIIQQGWENSRKIDPTENSTWLAGKIYRTTIVGWMCLEWNRRIIEVNRRFSKVMFDYRMVINSKYHVNWDFTSCKWNLTWFIVANPKKYMQDCSRTLRYEGGNWVDEEVTLSIFFLQTWLILACYHLKHLPMMGWSNPVQWGHVGDWTE